MTVSTTKNRINQLADGIQTVFPYDFIVQEESQMYPYFDSVVQAAGFTVNGVGDELGGDVTFAVAPTSGVIVTLQRIIDETQAVDYLPYDPFPAETHEGALDKLTLITQQNSDAIGRATVAPVSDDGSTDYTMPVYEAGKGVIWDAATKKLINSDDDINGITTAAQASADAALVSENAAAGSAAAAKASEDATIAAAGQNPYATSLVKLIHPDQSKGLAELQKQGVYPSSFNQQWGGMGCGGLPDGSIGEIATGYIKDNENVEHVGSSAANTYQAMGFKVSKTKDYTYFYVKIYKTGNPTTNLAAFLYSDDGAGKPNAVLVNGTATTQNGKLHTDNTDGEWVRFTLPVSQNLVAGTQYHIVLYNSNVGATNYWRWVRNNLENTYPHGYKNTGDATPAWTSGATDALLFIVDAENTILQSGLTSFDGALHHYEGIPLNQSGGFYFSNNELNRKRGMIHLAGTGWDKGKTFYDSGVGTDNNRIVIRCNVATGFAQVDLYEDDGTKHTVTGVTDISTGNRIVSVGYRAEGDGADSLKLYVDGVSEGVELTAQTIVLARAFEDGHATIGGGFDLAPIWTNDEDMSVLPSAGGMSFAGSAVEASVFSVSGGVLYQNGAGFGGAETGNYEDTTTSFVNATGLVVETKLEIEKSDNGLVSQGSSIRIYDGSKHIRLLIHEYFIEIYDVASLGFVQIDMTKLTTLKIWCKGSDFQLFANGKLVFDGVGLLTSVTAINSIVFGDQGGGAGNNSTVKWHYFKYFEGAHIPEYSTMQLSELVNWNDDKSSLLSTIYSSGIIQSVKTLAGMNENFVKSVKQVVNAKGITSAPSTTSTSLIPIDDMALFCFGVRPNATHLNTIYNSVNNDLIRLSLLIDGKNITSNSEEDTMANNSSTLKRNNIFLRNPNVVHGGLHFINASWRVDSGTGVGQATLRALTVEAE